jgi:hypothetical protein
MPRAHGSGFSLSIVLWKPELCHGLGEARAEIRRSCLQPSRFPRPSSLSLYKKEDENTQPYSLLSKPRLLIVRVPSMPSNVTNTCSSGSQDPASVMDAEKAPEPATKTASEKLDIEHVHVDDDPRKWSNMRKVSRPSITMSIFSNLVPRRAYLA